jgi:hypothetical protein
VSELLNGKIGNKSVGRLFHYAGQLGLVYSTGGAGRGPEILCRRSSRLFDRSCSIFAISALASSAHGTISDGEAIVSIHLLGVEALSLFEGLDCLLVSLLRGVDNP